MDGLNSLNGISSADLLKQKSSISAPSSGEEFLEHLKSALNDTNELQKESEGLISDMASGSVKDLHQAALAINKAEISMKLMLEIRNKALSAYKDLSRTQM